ncbi:MAG TPA: S8 family serine peptidase, partial [Ilumatobacteraceae bacterium]
MGSRVSTRGVDGFRGGPRSSDRRRFGRVGVAGLIAVTGAFVLGSAAISPAAASGPGPNKIDTGSLSAIAQITGADDMWNSGYTGQGVGVAVIDTGVARVPGLDQTGKVIDGPDLSFDSQSPNLAHVDAFGHGTHVAGIIAGSDVAPGTSIKGCQTCTGKSPYTDTTKFEGIAPDAKIINVKVGAFDGAA